MNNVEELSWLDRFDRRFSRAFLGANDLRPYEKRCFDAIRDMFAPEISEAMQQQYERCDYFQRVNRDRTVNFCRIDGDYRSFPLWPNQAIGVLVAVAHIEGEGFHDLDCRMIGAEGRISHLSFSAILPAIRANHFEVSSVKHGARLMANGVA